MAERADRRGKTADRPTGDGSSTLAARLAEFRSGSGIALAVAAVGILGGLLLALGEFLTVASVDVAKGSCEVINDTQPDLADRCELSGFERHGGAFLLFGLLVAAMAWGAGPGASRPAAIALIVVGVIVVAWVLASDLSEAGKTGAIGRNFEGATAKEGPAIYVDVAGALMAAGAGLMRLLWPAER